MSEVSSVGFLVCCWFLVGGLFCGGFGVVFCKTGLNMENEFFIRKSKGVGVVWKSQICLLVLTSCMGLNPHQQRKPS